MSVNPPRPEHPRPDRYRPDWKSLNGTWRFATDHERRGLDHRWFEKGDFRQEIAVPFAYQHELSGIDHKGVEEVVWYARTFEVPADWLQGDRSVLLHFGAVDYRCVVWVNGVEIGRNEGGHVPFSFDIAPFAKAGENLVVLRVEDPQDPAIPRGKQAIAGRPVSIFYYCTTGIWQSVWLESVARARIEDLVSSFQPDVLEFRCRVRAAPPGAEIRIEVSLDGAPVSTEQAPLRNGLAEIWLGIDEPKYWSPESPTLYSVKATLLSNGEVLDSLESYAGLRWVEAKDGKFWLNGEPYYLKMVLDQGYWPKSGLTAPSDDALREEVEWCKKLGFNGARKHQKVEDPRWLYWCDKLGLVVWGEMANAFAWSPEAADRLTREWTRAVLRDRSHPCIVTWVPVNESWGTPYLRDGHPEQMALLENLVALTKNLDPTRPVVDNDGWEHTEATDIHTLHDYTKTGKELFSRYEPTLKGGPMQDYTWGPHPICYLAKGAKYRGQPVMLTEVGGFLSIPPEIPPEKLDSL